MGWPTPADSRTAVRKAGQRIRAGQESSEDIGVLNRWRAAHGYIINTFQASLRNRAKGSHIPVAQRLKRAATIIDKLKQGRALDLATMQDIAGVRLVFPDIPSMIEFRNKLHETKAKHELMNEKEKYDYLIHPKASGYRGIHDVYRYRAGTETGSKWNGLFIEIQFRTLVQHAWATAVELSDAITSNRTKFSQGTPENELFFKICSELLARKFEDAPSCLQDWTHAQLIEAWRDIETKLHLFQQLKSVSMQESGGALTGFVLLIVQPHGDLVVESQKSYRDAVYRLISIETDHPDWDIVLVGGDRDESLRSAFRNYFRNASEFVSMMENALTD